MGKREGVRLAAPATASHDPPKRRLGLRVADHKPRSRRARGSPTAGARPLWRASG